MVNSMKEKLIPLILGFVLLFSIGLINTNSSTQSIQYVRQANSAIILNPENNFWYNEYL